MQIIFAAVDIPAKCGALGALAFLGRRYSQAACLFLSAVVIFANIFIPAGDLCTSPQNKVTSPMSRYWTSADQTAGTEMRPYTGLTQLQFTLKRSAECLECVNQPYETI